MTKTDKTLDYYNTQAASFAQSTLDVEFSALQDEFVSYLKEGASILDVGAGSGRDSAAFLKQGFKVTAIDGSAELAKLASKVLGQEVIVSTFQDYEPDQIFDGIWACASLLHLSREDIVKVMQKLAKALAADGVFYVSFKYGTFSGERNGRFFTDLTEDTFAEILKEVSELKIKRQFITEDARPGREAEKWLNVMLERA